MLNILLILIVFVSCNAKPYLTSGQPIPRGSLYPNRNYMFTYDVTRNFQMTFSYTDKISIKLIQNNTVNEVGNVTTCIFCDYHADVGNLTIILRSLSKKVVYSRIDHVMTISSSITPNDLMQLGVENGTYRYAFPVSKKMYFKLTFAFGCVVNMYVDYSLKYSFIESINKDIMFYGGNVIIVEFIIAFTPYNDTLIAVKDFVVY